MVGRGWLGRRPRARARPTPSFLVQVAASDAPVELRQAAAVLFKNHVKARWAPAEGDAEAGGGSVAQVPAADKERVRGGAVGLMLAAPPVVRAQLSEALVVIGGHDFPAAWPGLLPDLVARLRAAPGGSPAAHGVLATANAIYKRYRGAFMTEALSAELQYSQALVGPLLDALTGALAAARAAAADPDPRPAVAAVEAARLAVRIFFSLNSPGLTEEFEAALGPWMAALQDALTLECPPAATPPRAGDPAPLDALRAAVCDALNLFVEVNEDEFAPYLSSFARSVWALLAPLGPAPDRDALATAGTRFLTTVARGVHASLFAGDAALAQMVDAVVLPAFAWRDDWADAFESNYVDYVRADAEAADADTRRRAAGGLLRALAAAFPADVARLAAAATARLLAEAAADPVSGWRARHAAMGLVSALAARERAARAAPAAAAAAARGAAAPLVDVPVFYAAHVAPLLAARAAAGPGLDLGADVSAADGLRLLTAERDALPPPALAATLPSIIALLRCEAPVVHSYAATALERLVAPPRGPPRVGAAGAAPHVQPALEALFSAFAHPDSAENEYVMRAVARVLASAGPAVAAAAAPAVLAALSRMLLDAARNPRVPGFNHWLFEAVAVIARAAATAGEPAVAAVEAALFPAFEVVLRDDVQEFHPYAFQVLAQLVEARRGGGGGTGAGLPPAYLALLPPLLAPAHWERAGNVPALARLLRAIVVAAGADVVAAGALEPALGALQKLVSLKSADGEAGPLALALLRGIPPAALDPYLGTLWGLLFRRLQAARTARFARGVVLFASGFALLRGGAALETSVESVQPGLFAASLVGGVWAPGLGAAAAGGSPEDAKLLLAGAGAVLGGAPGLTTAGGGAPWGALAAAAAAAAAGVRAAPAAAAATPPDDDDAAPTGYGAAYSALAYAAPAPDDLVPAAASPAAALARALADASAARPGALPALVDATMPPDAAAALRSVCAGAGVALA